MAKLSKSLVIVGAKRTPFGTMLGALSGLSATDLAVHASKAALEQSRRFTRPIATFIFKSRCRTCGDRTLR